jgi:hypothetical protein
MQPPSEIPSQALNDEFAYSANKARFHTMSVTDVSLPWLIVLR